MNAKNLNDAGLNTAKRVKNITNQNAILDRVFIAAIVEKSFPSKPNVKGGYSARDVKHIARLNPFLEEAKFARVVNSRAECGMKDT